MGNSYLVPARSNASSGLLAQTPPPPTTRSAPASTGDPYVDHGTVCDPTDPAHAELWRHHVDAECFMAPSQRGRQVAKLQARINDAKVAYAGALEQLRVDELLKKPSDGAWAFELLLDVVGLAAIPALGRAVSQFRAGDLHGVADIVKDATDAATVRRTAASGELGNIIKQVVTTAKRSVPRPSSQHDKGHLDYLKRLSIEAAHTFQHLREALPAKCTDVDLLVVTEAYDSSNGHSLEAYKEGLEAQLQHFDDSGLSMIGAQWNDHGGLFSPEKMDTRAYWVQMPTGLKLALYRAVHIPGTAEGDLLQLPIHEVSADEAARRRQRATSSQSFEFLRYVPDDLSEVAVQMHTERWGTAPEVRAPGGAEWAGMGGVTR